MQTEQPQIHAEPWWQRYRNALLVALLALVVMMPAVRHQFINWDDNRLVTDNEAITTTAGIGTIWSSLELPRHYPNYPLTMTSYWIEHQIWGLDPTGYHAVNILLHALNAALVLILLRRLGLCESASFLAAALFAAHPMQVESVAWISERKNVLFTFFALLSIISYISFLKTDKRKHWGWALAAFVAALLSKTAAVTVPCTLLATVWFKRGKLKRGDWLQLVPFFALSLVAGVLTTGAEATPREVLPMLWRPLLAVNTLAFYLARLVFPVSVVPVHPKWQFVPSGVFLVAPLALLVVSALLFRYRQRMPRIVTWGMLHFLACLGPFLGLISFGYHETSYVADRFVYFASIGLFAPMAVGIMHVLARFDHKTALSVCSMYVGLMAGITMMYVNVWHDSFTLWTYTLKHSPDCARAHNNLAIVYEQRGEPEVALAHYAYAMQVDHTLCSAPANYAAIMARMGDFPMAEKYYMHALQIEEHDPNLHYRIGCVLEQEGRYEDALVHLRLASVLDPTDAEIYNAAGFAHEKLGDLDKAVYLYRKTLELQPTHPIATQRLARVLEQQSEAVAHVTPADVNPE